MKTKEQLKTLRKKDVKKLYQMLNEEYKSLHKYRFATKFRNLKNIQKIKTTKKNIARIYTILGEKLNTNSQE